MITPAHARALKELERTLILTCGDRGVAQRIVRDAKQGGLSKRTTFDALERAVGRHCGDKRLARQIRAAVESQTQATAAQAPAIVRAQPLLDAGAADWAKEPKSKEAVLVEAGSGCIIVDKGQRITNPRREYSYTKTTKASALSIGGFRTHVEKKGIEDRVGHFYKDSKGLITIGIGHRVKGEPEARRLARDSSLAFVFKESRRPLTTYVEGFVVSDYKAVREKPGGQEVTADKFESLTTVALDDPSMNRLFEADVSEFIRLLKRRDQYRDYDSYPLVAKLAVLDMAYNLGVKGLADGYPRFTDAAWHRDWEGAALQSNRPGATAHRNKAVRDWLMAAAEIEPFYIRSPKRGRCTKKLDDFLRKLR